MDSKNTFLRGNGYCRNLYFYRKSMVIYDMTFYFVKKYLPPYGDRTVDQMIQAARSGKQNFVEGMADGVTSFEMQIKLLNVGNTRLPTNGISAAMAKAFGATIPMRNGLPKQCGNEIVGNPSLLLWK